MAAAKAQPSDLEDILTNIAETVYTCQEGVNLFSVVSDYSMEINKTNFSHFFGRLQGRAVNQFLLDVPKLFEEPRRYALNSIPQALDLLPKCQLRNRSGLLRWLPKYGIAPSDVNALNDEQLLCCLARTISAQTPSVRNSKALERLVTLRNKQIAHSEFMQAGSLPLQGVTLTEIDELLSFAKQFVGMAGDAFTDKVWVDQNWNFTFDYDAGKTEMAAKRVLVELRIIESPFGR